MFHSSWDLEVFARDLQDRRMREAEAARRVNAVRPASEMIAGDGVIGRVTRTVAKLRLVLSPRQAAVGGQVSHEPLVAGVARLTVAQVAPQGTPPARTHRHADPFATMTVIAKGPVLAAAEQHSTVGDC